MRTQWIRFIFHCDEEGIAQCGTKQWARILTLWLRTCVTLRKSLRLVDSVLSSVKSRLWILLSHKRESIWVGSNEVDEPRAYYASKSEREKQIWHMKAYIWNLDRWYCWTYLQGSNSDAGIKNRLVGTVGEGEGGTNGESSINTHQIRSDQSVSRVRLFETPWITAHQASQSVTPNLCCEETKPRSIHSPDKRKRI